MNAKAARAIKTVFYALDVVNQGMQEKQSITVRCMDIEDLEKQAEAIRVEQIKRCATARCVHRKEKDPFGKTGCIAG